MTTNGLTASGGRLPGLPYAWSRELDVLGRAGLTPEQRAAITSGTARRLFVDGR